MEGVLSLASHHPLIAIIIAAIAVVVVFYFVKQHFWRIVTVLVLTVIGYSLYLNGYFTKEKIESLKSVDVKVLERKAEAGLEEGITGAKSLSADMIDKKADRIRKDVKKEVMPALSENPSKDSASRAAAAPAAKKRHTPAAGDKSAK